MKGFYSASMMLAVMFISFNREILLPDSIPSPTPRKAINKLNWVEVTTNRFYSQIMFDFARPVYCRKKIIPENHQLKLSFPGMTLKQFNQEMIEKPIQKLKDAGLIKHVTIQEKNEPVPQINMLITFKHSKNSDDDVIVKWSKMNDPFRFILDIFTEKHLKRLQNQNNIILYAQNNNIMRDYDLPQTHKKRAPRIIIDAGHGGDDPGATKFGLKEKDIALDVAEKVRKTLTNQGHTALLTRNYDTTLSLLERSELAEQLDADLFVSIHVNAAPMAREKQSSGIETYFLRQTTRLPTHEQGGYFACGRSTEKHIEKLTNLMQQASNYSSHLAHTIQSSLIKQLEPWSNSLDRGVKENNSRVLLRSLVPCALVEVGFITHEEEAKRLSCKEYRLDLAHGISNGILSYIQTHY